MPPRASVRSRTLAVIGFVLALVGLVGQLSAGRVAAAEDAGAWQRAALAAVSFDCQASPATASHGGTRHRHHRTEPASCPTRAALELAGYTLLPPVTIPATGVAVAAEHATTPPARGPPPAITRLVHARAPPATI